MILLQQKHYESLLVIFHRNRVLDSLVDVLRWNNGEYNVKFLINMDEMIECRINNGYTISDNDCIFIGYKIVFEEEYFVSWYLKNKCKIW